MSVLPSTADVVGPPRHVRKVPILLQKSAATDRAVMPFVKGRGFDPPALTPATQLQRYAVHRAWAGGGVASSDASRRGFWAMAARTNSSWAPRGPRSRSRP